MKTLSILLYALLLVEVSYAASIERHDETASGARGWRIQDSHIMIELNPLYKDQVRAFYLGRGFSEQVTEHISQSCVFQTVIKNVSSPKDNVLVEVNLADWWIVGEAGSWVALIDKASRLHELEAAGASNASLLAFRWATFPEQQEFKLSGDYGWGMILFGEQTDNRFDLLVKWRANGLANEQLIKNLTCLGELPTTEN